MVAYHHQRDEKRREATFNEATFTRVRCPLIASNLTSNNPNFGESDALKPLDLIKACRKGPLEAPHLVKFSPQKNH